MVTVLERISFFVILFMLVYGFAWMQQALLSHKTPWVWRLGISVAFMALCLLLFERWAFSLEYFSQPEAFIYLFIALCVFATITAVNGIRCLTLLRVRFDRRTHVVIGGSAFTCFVIAALYYAYHPVVNILYELKTATFITALCAVATGLLVLLLESKRK